MAENAHHDGVRVPQGEDDRVHSGSTFLPPRAGAIAANRNRLRLLATGLPLRWGGFGLKPLPPHLLKGLVVVLKDLGHQLD